MIYITTTLPQGTGEPFLIPEIKELLRLGHELRIIPMAPRGRFVHSDTKTLLPHVVLERLISPSILYRATRRVLRHPKCVLAALKVLWKSKTWKIGLKNCAVVPKALWLADKALAVDADHIHAHWGGCTATMAMIASRVSGIPWSVTIHSWEICENNLLAEKSADAIFVRTISEFGAKRLQRTVDCSPRVLHLGIDLPRTTDSRSDDSERFRILTVGALLPVKGHQYLLEAWELLRSRGIVIEIEIIGDGPLQKALTAQIRRYRAEQNISLLGQLSHDELLAKMSAGRWTSMVLPSVIAEDGQQEGIPMSLVEAMARGLPVISTLTGGIPELLGHGAGLLVPQRNSRALANAIESLATNLDLRHQLSLAGRKRANEEFNVKTIAQALIHLTQPTDEVTEHHGAHGIAKSA